MIKRLSILALFVLVMGTIIYSCKKDEFKIPVEPVKSISGSWKVTKALRNGTDMTQRFDFSKFRINFQENTYTMSNLVPFIVNAEGAWSFDDNQYPFVLRFQANGDTPKTSTVQYNVKNGVRNIVISFSPGCYTNSYEYTLEKEN